MNPGQLSLKSRVLECHVVKVYPERARGPIMKRTLFVSIFVIAAIGCFLAGSMYSRWETERSQPSGERRVLYYVDPMNPSHTSDKPGLAPCGMKLEPVYADGSDATNANGSAAPPGTVKITPQKQQLIGMRTAVVEKTATSHVIRLPGRVRVDETRLYLINATVDGWITEARSNSSWSLVKKDEVLASFYSPEFLSAAQALLFALNSMDRVQNGGTATFEQSDQMTQFNINLQQYRDSLKNLGMGDRQIDDLIHTRQFVENIHIVAPADGFVIERAVSRGQRFEKGRELYRIADLSKVWIEADLFEREAEFIRPGLKVEVVQPNRSKVLQAVVSDVHPKFDAISRTLKVRLEADNPEFLLRPDMFVDVTVAVPLPEAIVLPADAILDSGLEKRVFVDLGNGFFEPRQVDTGWRMGDRVEIKAGLMAGERIVTSGNFLVDSESRMKLAAAGMGSKTAKCPVCGMSVNESHAKTSGLEADREGQHYYFCSEQCKTQFMNSEGPAGSHHAQRETGERVVLASINPVIAGAQPAAQSDGEVSGNQSKGVVAEERKPASQAAPPAPQNMTQHSGHNMSMGMGCCMMRHAAAPAGHQAHNHAMPPAAKAPDRQTPKEVCPVCGMTVDPNRAKAAGRQADYLGKTYFFCSVECKQQFALSPGRFLGASEAGQIAQHSKTSY